ncbi:MAG: efflux RND transporter periplasmic adaptor subunit [Candidatus Eisenbacteria bacterium]|nr:efflux RND transporter periplasmic adaptor subunit [Candidatus Eisenbacteria bacterium]
MKLGRKRVLIGAAVVLVILFIIVGNLRRSSEKALGVQISKVTKGTITSTVRAPGKIRPETKVEISASLPGQIVNLPVHEGQWVEQGQLLLQLDRSEYVAQVEQSKAALGNAKASLSLAQASLAQAKSVYERKKVLSEKNLSSPEELESARTQYDVQGAQVEAARQMVAQAAAALNIAQDNLKKTTFLAPQAGVVSELNVEKGEIVVVGTMNMAGTVIMTVADLAHMQVECDVDETDVVSIEKGQRAKVFVDAFPDTVLEGTVVEIGSSGQKASAASDASATDFTVKLSLEPGSMGLKPDMTADAEITTATHTDALRLPIQAIVVRDKKTVDKWTSKRSEESKKGVKGKTATVKGPKKEKGGQKAEETTKVASAAKPEGKVEKASAAKADSAAQRDTSASPGASGTGKPASDEVTGVFVVDGQTVKFVPVETGIMSETDVEILKGISQDARIVTGPFRVLRDLKDGQKVKEEKKEKEDANSKGKKQKVAD